MVSVIGIIFLFFNQSYQITSTEQIPKSFKQVLSINRFQIPKLNIDTNIEPVGLTKDGAMDSPVSPMPVGWFKLGPKPGEIGSAVIAGHSGWKNNIPAVFDNLHKLQKGDKVYVTDEKGVKTTFIVRELRIYKPKDDASLVFGSNDGGAHLNLITCSGFWNTIWKSHSDRLVVFTDKEDISS